MEMNMLRSVEEFDAAIEAARKWPVGTNSGFWVVGNLLKSRDCENAGMALTYAKNGLADFI